MAQYDGSIRIGTQIDIKGFKDGEKEIESESRRVAESVSKTVQKDARQIEKELENLKDAQKSFLEAGGTKVSPVYQEYENEINKLQETLQSLKNTQDDTEIADEHWNQLRIDIEEYAKSLKELQDQGQFFGDEDYDKIYLAWKNATDAVKAYQAELNKQTASGQAKIAEQEAKAAKRKEAAQRKAEEQAEKALQKENARIQKEAEAEAKLQAAEAERQAKIAAETAEEERLAQIRENAVVGNQRIVESLERIKQLEEEIADLKKAGVTEGYSEYDKRIQELSELKQEVKDYNSNISQVKESYKKLGNTAKQSFDKINKSAKKTNSLLSQTGIGFKNILKYGLGIRSLYALFNKLRSAIKEGFSNLYNDKNITGFKASIDNLKASLLTLKNSFAAAFRPLIEIAIPYIQKAVEYLTILMDKFGQFIALAMGQKNYTKAIKQTTAALKDQNKAQNKQLSSLDRLNNLTSADGAGAIDTGAVSMFEEAPVDEKLPSIFKQIVGYAENLKNIFSQGFWDGLGDWEYRWDSVKESIGTIKDSLSDIWTDPAVLSSADQYSESVAYMLGSLAGSAESIGLTLAVNLLGGISKYLKQNKGRIKEFIVSMFDIGATINQLISDFSGAFAFIFEAFATEDAQQLTANLIGIFTDAVMGSLEILGELARDILNIFIQPFVDNKEEFRTALEGFLSVLSEVTGTIKEGIDETFSKLNEVYEEHFKPFFDSLANGLSDTVGKFMEFWNTYVQPILEKWATQFDSLWKEHLQPVLDSFIELFGDLADYLKAKYEQFLKPLIDFIIQYILPGIVDAMDKVADQFFIAFGIISDVVGGIIDVLGGIIKFLTGVFTGDWEKAWSGVVKIFSGIKDALKGIINGILGIVESLANGVIKGMNIVIGSFNGLHFDIPDWVPGIGGNSVGFNIPELKQISIPRLATGAVIPANKEFLAVLGDQKHGTNIEAPEDLIRKIVREETAKSNNSGGGDVNLHLTVECEGYKLLELMKKLDGEYFKQNGKHALA